MKESQRYPSRSHWNAVVNVAVVLLTGSVMPLPLPRRPDSGRFGPDKLLHFVGHTVLAATLVTALGTERRSKRTAAILAVGSSTAYGIVTNSLQRWIPGRVGHPSVPTWMLASSVRWSVLLPANTRTILSH